MDLTESDDSPLNKKQARTKYRNFSVSDGHFAVVERIRTGHFEKTPDSSNGMKELLRLKEKRGVQDSIWTEHRKGYFMVDWASREVVPRVPVGVSGVFANILNIEGKGNFKDKVSVKCSAVTPGVEPVVDTWQLQIHRDSEKLSRIHTKSSTTQIKYRSNWLKNRKFKWRKTGCFLVISVNFPKHEETLAVMIDPPLPRKKKRPATLSRSTPRAKMSRTLKQKPAKSVSLAMSRQTTSTVSRNLQSVAFSAPTTFYPSTSMTWPTLQKAAYSPPLSDLRPQVQPPLSLKSNWQHNNNGMFALISAVDALDQLSKGKITKQPKQTTS